MIRTCRTRGCQEWIGLRGPLRLCPSCRYLARWAFLAGSFVAGAASALFPYLKEWFS